MANVTVHIDGMKEVQDMFGRFKVPNKAISRSINKALVSAKTEAWREIKQHWNIRQTLLYKQFKIEKAYWNRLSGSLLASNKRLRYEEMGGVKQKPTGVKVKAVKGAGGVIKHAYLTTIGKSGQIGVMQREVYGGRNPKKFPANTKFMGSYGALPLKYRTPVEHLRAASGAMMLDSPPGKKGNSLEKVQKKASDVFQKELSRQVDLLANNKV